MADFTPTHPTPTTSEARTTRVLEQRADLVRCDRELAERIQGLIRRRLQLEAALTVLEDELRAARTSSAAPIIPAGFELRAGRWVDVGEELSAAPPALPYLLRRQAE